MKSLISKPEPGAFHARCALKRHVPEKKLTVQQLADAERLGYPRRFVEMVSERVDPVKRKHGRWEITFPACAGFETTDKAAYAAHMRDEHGGSRAEQDRGLNEVFARSVRAGWRSPRLLSEGKPFDDARTLTCTTCGLVGEVTTEASMLWFTEHQRGCALAASGVAS